MAKELVAIPRGGPGQNVYRMVCEQVRLDGLGSQAQVEATPQGGQEFALGTAQEHRPDFQPELR